MFAFALSMSSIVNQINEYAYFEEINIYKYKREKKQRQAIIFPFETKNKSKSRILFL